MTEAKAKGRQVRAPGGLLQRLERRVALEALGESSHSFGTEEVYSQTVCTGAKAGAEECQRAPDTEANTGAHAAHLSEVTELPLSPSHSLVMPSVMSSFP